MITETQSDLVRRALDSLAIELPSWGIANTGTRFRKFIQPSAAATTQEKFADASAIHRFTGCCPSVADVRPVIRDWRRSKGLPEDPLASFRESGYARDAEGQRAESNRHAFTSYA